MKLLDQVISGKQPRPRRVLIYGPHGVGKSTFAAMAERPIFISTEDGLSDIDCDSFPLAQSYQDVIDALYELCEGEHDYRTVAIDSPDWLEKLIWARVCQDQGVRSIEEIGYGKGYVFAMDYWRQVLQALSALRERRGMTVLLVAHSKIEKFDNPETESYDRYSLWLHKTASAYVRDWCDEVLFANFRVYTKKSGQGFNKERFQGVGTGERVIRTNERPAFAAKNRLGLPDEIPLDYREFAAYVRGEKTATVETDEPEAAESGTAETEAAESAMAAQGA